MEDGKSLRSWPAMATLQPLSDRHQAVLRLAGPSSSLHPCRLHLSPLTLAPHTICKYTSQSVQPVTWHSAQFVNILSDLSVCFLHIHEKIHATQPSYCVAKRATERNLGQISWNNPPSNLNETFFKHFLSSVIHNKKDHYVRLTDTM